MRINTLTFAAIAAFLILTVLFSGFSCCRRVPDARLIGGRLSPCPDRPNCVSSESAAESARIAPLAFDGSPEKAWQKLKDAVHELGGKVQKEQPGYLWVTFTTRVFRFVDDAEFRMAPTEGVIHFRSSSRIGFSDLGVNRRRMEKLRAIFHRKADFQH